MACWIRKAHPARNNRKRGAAAKKASSEKKGRVQRRIGADPRAAAATATARGGAPGRGGEWDEGAATNRRGLSRNEKGRPKSVGREGSCREGGAWGKSKELLGGGGAGAKPPLSRLSSYAPTRQAGREGRVQGAKGMVGKAGL